MLNHNSVYNGDCLELMKEIPDKSINMILCDLPYEQTSRNKWDKIIDFDKLWKQYERIIKDNGAIVLNANGMFTAKLMASNEKLWRYNLVWDKVLSSGHLNANKMQMRQHEDICVFYKKQPIYNPQKTIGKEKNHAKRVNGEDDGGTNYGKAKRVDNSEELGNLKHPTSILKFEKDHPSKNLHPTQKPVALFEYLINTYTNEGDLILDNCAGSGTTAIACINTKRDYILIEKEPKYFEIINERINNHIKQLSLMYA